MDRDQSPRNLDEATRRRPDFAGGEVVVLADRREWRLPIVGARIEPRITAAGPVPVPIWFVGDGPTDPAFEDAMQAAYDRFIGVAPGEHPGQQRIIDLGTVLLRRNYDVTPGEADWLLYEGFWRRARGDGCFLSLAAAASNAIMRLGFAGPLERAERLKAGLPRHRGPAFEAGAN